MIFDDGVWPGKVISTARTNESIPKWQGAVVRWQADNSADSVNEWEFELSTAAQEREKAQQSQREMASRTSRRLLSAAAAASGNADAGGGGGSGGGAGINSVVRVRYRPVDVRRLERGTREINAQLRLIVEGLLDDSNFQSFVEMVPKNEQVVPRVRLLLFHSSHVYLLICLSVCQSVCSSAAVSSLLFS